MVITDKAIADMVITDMVITDMVATDIATSDHIPLESAMFTQQLHSPIQSLSLFASLG